MKITEDAPIISDSHIATDKQKRCLEVDIPRKSSLSSVSSSEGPLSPELSAVKSSYNEEMALALPSIDMPNPTSKSGKDNVSRPLRPSRPLSQSVDEPALRLLNVNLTTLSKQKTPKNKTKKQAAISRSSSAHSVSIRTPKPKRTPSRRMWHESHSAFQRRKYNDSSSNSSPARTPSATKHVHRKNSGNVGTRRKWWKDDIEPTGSSQSKSQRKTWNRSRPISSVKAKKKKSKKKKFVGNFTILVILHSFLQKC